jgi:DNA-binding NarL/FixJ family response regulator
MSAAFAMSRPTLINVAQSRSKPRTLVVDDSPTILHAICTLLEHREIVEVVGRAETGADAINAVAEHKPELVLMDADMPGMSGLRTSLLLSQIAPSTRVVLMSMDSSAHFRRACSGCGAHAVIYKPKFLSELVKLLHGAPVSKWERPTARPPRKNGQPVTIMR